VVDRRREDKLINKLLNVLRKRYNVEKDDCYQADIDGSADACFVVNGKYKYLVEHTQIVVKNSMQYMHIKDINDMLVEFNEKEPIPCACLIDRTGMEKLSKYKLRLTKYKSEIKKQIYDACERINDYRVCFVLVDLNDLSRLYFSIQRTHPVRTNFKRIAICQVMLGSYTEDSNSGYANWE